MTDKQVLEWISATPLHALLCGWTMGFITGIMGGLVSIGYFIPGVRQAIRKVLEARP